VRGTVKREDVLDVAATLFAANGYKATSLQLVGDELSVTRQALYYHFRDKGEILAGLFDQLMTKLEDGVAEAALVEPPERRFGGMLRAHIVVIAENRDLAAVLLHERPEMAKLDVPEAAERRHQYMRQFSEAYADGVALGHLRPADPSVAANALVAAANGISWWYRSGRGGTPREVAEMVLELLRGGFHRLQLANEQVNLVQ